MAKGQGQGVVLGYLRYVLGFDSLAFQEGLGDADKRLKAAQRTLSKTADKFQSAGAIMSVGITAPFVALATAAIPAAQESQVALGQVQSALASMGDAAQRTLPQLQAQAEALMRLSTFDDDDILKKVTANLLTFGNVSGDVFDRAQLAAVNLSARLGQDLQSSAIQLGKALNDPVKGITALSRVGVSFTEQQREQIKAMVAAGDTAGAQGIILGELEKQYGGAAKALRDATPGIESQQAWADFQETIGKVALQVIPPLNEALSTLLGWFNNLSPRTQTFVVGAAAVAAALGPITLGVGGLISAFGILLPAIGPIAAALGTVATVITAGVIPALSSLIVALSPVLVPLAAVAAGVGAVYLAWKNWDKIEPIVRNMYNAVKTWVLDKLNAVWNGVKAGIDTVKNAFFNLYDAVVGHSYIPDMVEGIKVEMDKLPNVMVAPVADATEEAAKNFEHMAKGILGSLQGLAYNIKNGGVLDILSSVLDVFTTLGGAGVFGAKMKTRIDGARAFGGPVTGGKTYLVGERGPELFTASRSGYIHPNGSNDNGGMPARIIIEPSPYFDARVDGRAANIAAPLSAQAAGAGSTGAQVALARKQGRTLP